MTIDFNELDDPAIPMANKILEDINIPKLKKYKMMQIISKEELASFPVKVPEVNVAEFKEKLISRLTTPYIVEDDNKNDHSK